MTEDSIPPLLLQTIITIPIFWYTKKGGPKGKLVMNEEYTRKTSPVSASMWLLFTSLVLHIANTAQDLR